MKLNLDFINSGASEDDLSAVRRDGGIADALHVHESFFVERAFVCALCSSPSSLGSLSRLAQRCDRKRNQKKQHHRAGTKKPCRRHHRRYPLLDYLLRKRTWNVRFCERVPLPSTRPPQYCAARRESRIGFVSVARIAGLSKTYLPDEGAVYSGVLTLTSGVPARCSRSTFKRASTGNEYKCKASHHR